MDMCESRTQSRFCTKRQRRLTQAELEELEFTAPEADSCHALQAFRLFLLPFLSIFLHFSRLFGGLVKLGDLGDRPQRHLG